MSEKKVHSFFRKHIRMEVIFAVHLLKKYHIRYWKEDVNAKNAKTGKKYVPCMPPCNPARLSTLLPSPFINPFTQSFYPLCSFPALNPAIRQSGSNPPLISAFPYFSVYGKIHCTYQTKARAITGCWVSDQHTDQDSFSFGGFIYDL